MIHRPAEEEPTVAVSPTLSETPHIHGIAARTPADRDRYLDLLRAFAIAVVVLGHWLVAVVWIEDGTLRARPLLDLAPATQWLTWFVQVMPVFFLVGGVVNARSWRSARRRGEGYASWVQARSVRLLYPTVALLWFWALAGPLFAAGFPADLVGLAARNALLPLWFLATYLALIALTPPLLALHRRLGLRLPLALGALVAATDLAARGFGFTEAGLASYVVVWAVPVVLGFCWGDGLLERRALRWGLPLAGATLLVLLVGTLGYSVSMVGIDGAARSNNAPPSLALVALACVQTGIVLAARAPVARWLARPRVWAAVVRLNLVAMTVYLWHLTVMMLVVGGVTAAGWWLHTAPLSVAWWASRPVWLALLGVALAGVVAAVAPVELRAPRPRAGLLPAPLALTAIVTAAAGLTGIVVLGPSGPALAAMTLAVTASAATLSGLLPGLGQDV